MFRNKRRTILSGLAVGIGLASLIFVNGLLEGMLQSMVSGATNSFMGQGQVHAEGFRDTYEAELTIKDLKNVINILEADETVSGYTSRTITQGMLTSSADVVSVVAYGIDPLGEQQVSQLSEVIVEGEYLKPDSKRKILIGSRASELLDAGIGERLVLTIAQAGTGELSQEMFRVGGIFHYGIRDIDSYLVFTNLEKAQTMLRLPDRAHEVAIKFNDIKTSGETTLPLWDKLSTNGNEALGWPGLLPSLKAAHDLSNFSTFLTSILVFGIVALTIMNTLFMSLYERMYEFGVMRAVGTRPISMALMIVLEAISLAVVSMVIGIILGYTVNTIFGIVGIDYSGIEFAGVTLTEPIYTTLNVKQFTLFPLMILLFSLIASLYPAIYAARLMPAKAIKRSL